MNMILSTIGTSLLTHKVNDQERFFLNKYANFSYEDIPKADLSALTQFIDRAKNRLNNQDLNEIQKLSAELNGILSYYQNDLSNKRNDYHLLIATDTYEGKETALLVKEFLDRYNMLVEVKVIKGLKTDNTQSFTDGVKKLIAYLFENIEGYEEVVFNLTGGFKAIQAYLNTVGMFLANKLIYLFETGKLINIPALPLKFDNYELMERYASFFAMLDKQRNLDKNKFPNTLWENISEIYYDEVQID
ncbi:MAG: putative CRISPR-associated protein, partial [Candidatus Cloacimonetes bacterium]|nr:putative CRISPR-associated protein [Candidatus Cloacimonadota bacterium]